MPDIRRWRWTRARFATPVNGTDVASAIQLGLATMGKDAMHRLLLIWDGNPTTGDLDAAIAAAAAQHVPIDVMPLDYDVQNEVLVERFVAPTWKRENEPFTIEVFLRSHQRDQCNRQADRPAQRSADGSGSGDAGDSDDADGDAAARAERRARARCRRCGQQRHPPAFMRLRG